MSDALVHWAYKELEANTANVGGLMQYVNEAAKDGWELVDMVFADKTIGMNSMFAVMRRPLDHPEDPEDLTPGWKADPQEVATQRFWDGQLWTIHTRGTPTRAEAPPPDHTNKPAWREYLGRNASNQCKSRTHNLCSKNWCTCACHPRV